MRREGLDSQLEESTRELSGMEAVGKVIEDVEEAAGPQVRGAHLVSSSRTLFGGHFRMKQKRSLRHLRLLLGPSAT